MTLFLCGDVMTGRGIDQILAHPSGPRICEPSVQDARDYVALAERRNGPIGRPATPGYIWGDALAELTRSRPDVRLVNLETSITTSETCWLGKGINYRMHPANVGCLTAAQVDVCALANNHVLDFGDAGLVETLDVLARAGIKTAGAGRTLAEARAPAIVTRADGARTVVFACGTESSGIPGDWGARDGAPGIDVLPDLSDETARQIVDRARRVRQPPDCVVVSIHWGGNWGYGVPEAQVRFAHRLIDGGVDVVHGHSSHHPRPIEVYRGRLVLYGCGDVINDYEGIEGHERYRGDLGLLYFAALADSGALMALRMVPMQMKRFRLERSSRADAAWLCGVLDRESGPFGTHVDVTPEGALVLRRQDASRLPA